MLLKSPVIVGVAILMGMTALFAACTDDHEPKRQPPAALEVTGEWVRVAVEPSPVPRLSRLPTTRVISAGDVLLIIDAPDPTRPGTVTLVDVLHGTSTALPDTPDGDGRIQLPTAVSVNGENGRVTLIMAECDDTDQNRASFEEMGRCETARLTRLTTGDGGWNATAIPTNEHTTTYYGASGSYETEGGTNYLLVPTNAPGGEIGYGDAASWELFAATGTEPFEHVAEGSGRPYGLCATPNGVVAMVNEQFETLTSFVDVTTSDLPLWTSHIVSASDPSEQTTIVDPTPEIATHAPSGGQLMCDRANGSVWVFDAGEAFELTDGTAELRAAFDDRFQAHEIMNGVVHGVTIGEGAGPTILRIDHPSDIEPLRMPDDHLGAWLTQGPTMAASSDDGLTIYLQRLAVE